MMIILSCTYQVTEWEHPAKPGVGGVSVGGGGGGVGVFRMESFFKSFFFNRKVVHGESQNA